MYRDRLIFLLSGLLAVMSEIIILNSEKVDRLAHNSNYLSYSFAQVAFIVTCILLGFILQRSHFSAD